MAGLEIHDMEYDGICGDENCNVRFEEEHILYLCEKCMKYYCFKCYCNSHFEKHGEWLAYIIKDGKPRPFTTLKL